MKRLPKNLSCAVSQAGLTIVELVLVLALLSLLLGLSVPSLINFQTKTTLDSVAQVLVADIKEQQLRAMLGEKEGGNDPKAYGIYLQADQYIVYRGTSYASGDNYFTSKVPEPMVLIGVPLDINFIQRSGEISASSVSFTIRDNTTGESRQILINKLGGLEIH